MALIDGTFRTLSRLRAKRIAHPHGVGFEATFTGGAMATGAEIFDAAGPRPALVRLSRALGLPEALPDPCGLAIRLPDAYGPGAHQDLLLVTSARPPAARHLLLPSRGFGSRPYSSLLPYRAGGVLGLVGASARGGPVTLDELRGGAAAPSFTLAFATPGGSWRAVGRLELGDRIAPARTEGLCFDPSNTGGGLELAGLINRLRRPAYRGSQEGRGAYLAKAPA